MVRARPVGEVTERTFVGSLGVEQMIMIMMYLVLNANANDDDVFINNS